MVVAVITAAAMGGAHRATAIGFVSAFSRLPVVPVPSAQTLSTCPHASAGRFPDQRKLSQLVAILNSINVPVCFTVLVAGLKHGRLAR